MLEFGIHIIAPGFTEIKGPFTEQGLALNQSVTTLLDIQYNFAAPGSNNGKLASQTDVLSGEQIVYTYDALSRLATAVTADNPSVTQWGQSYTYDGFGNLTDQNVIKGSAPTMHVAYNYQTNRQTGDTADSNGNIGSGYLYDIENRLLRPGASSTVQYGYDAGNRRVWRGDTGVDEIVFRAGSQKLITYNVTRSGSTITGIASSSTNVYFGGRLMYKGAPNYPASSLLTGVKQDRLGSMNGKFYPYGQERPSATANDKEKFTGYFRDASTGLDYADQRYHQPGVGRFMSPDPYGGSAGPSDPGSWNRYAYVGGDPVNHTDRSGLNMAWDAVDGGGGGWGDGGWTDFSFGGGGWLDFGHSYDAEGDVTDIWLTSGGGNTQFFLDPYQGGGGGSSKPTTCTQTLNAFENNMRQFAADHWKDAQRIGKATGLDAGFILGWASVESFNATADGLGDAATLNSNFFGLTYRGRQSPTVWNDSVDCPEGSYDGIRGPGGHSCFGAADGFFQSGMSALMSFGSKYLNAASRATDSSYSTVGTAIAEAGYNRINPANYGASIQVRWDHLKKYTECAK